MVLALILAMFACLVVTSLTSGLQFKQLSQNLPRLWSSDSAMLCIALLSCTSKNSGSHLPCMHLRVQNDCYISVLPRITQRLTRSNAKVGRACGGFEHSRSGGHTISSSVSRSGQMYLDHTKTSLLDRCWSVPSQNTCAQLHGSLP